MKNNSCFQITTSSFNKSQLKTRSQKNKNKKENKKNSTFLWYETLENDLFALNLNVTSNLAVTSNFL